MNCFSAVALNIVASYIYDSFKNKKKDAIEIINKAFYNTSLFFHQQGVEVTVECLQKAFIDDQRPADFIFCDSQQQTTLSFLILRFLSIADFYLYDQEKKEATAYDIICYLFQELENVILRDDFWRNKLKLHYYRIRHREDEVQRKQIFDELKKLINRKAIFPHLIGLQSEIRRQLDEIKSGTTYEFDVRIKKCDNFEEINILHNSTPSSNYPSDALSPELFINNLRANTIYLIQSPGGTGKTKFACRTIELMIAKDFVPLYINFGQDKNDSDLNNSSPPKVNNYLDWYCNHGDFGVIQKLDDRDLQHKGVIIVDGLNQSTQNCSKIIDQLMTWQAKKAPGVSIIIFDRLTIRDCQQNPQSYTILPLSQKEIYKYVDNNNYSHICRSWLSLLSSPFFLNLFLINVKYARKSTFPKRIDLIEQYFTEYLMMEESNIKNFGKLAYIIYDEFEQTHVPETIFQQIVNRVSININWKSCDFIITTNNGVGFRHQLFQDGLIALFLTKQEKRWNPKLFDIITLHAASLDILELISEKLANSTSTDKLSEFITEMYDWSYIGARISISSLFCRYEESAMKFPYDLFNAIISLTSEKKFDKFYCTSNREKQQNTYLINKNDKIHTKTLANIENLKAIIKNITFTSDYITEGGKTFTEWKELFLFEKDFSMNDLNNLLEDPITSWTAANVFRREEVVKKEEFWKTLQEWYWVSRKTSRGSEQAQGFRWRIMHLLGASSKMNELEFLYNIIFDKEEVEWVRFGAARSFIDVASRMVAYDEKLMQLANDYSTLLKEGDSASKVRKSILEHLRFSDCFPTNEGWKDSIKKFIPKLLENYDGLENKEYEKWLPEVYITNGELK